MSETASTHATERLAPPHRTGGATTPALLPSLEPLLREWLPRQRWFAGKGRPVTGFQPVSATEVLPCPGPGGSPGLLHLLIRAEQSGPPQALGTPDCYQLLLGVHDTLPPRLASALVGRPRGGPLAGLTVYDALLDPRLCAVLMERLRAPGRLGALRFHREAAATVPPGLLARPLTAEQSNSSVVFGDAYILKIFRRVSPGRNPDLELPLTLARAGCGRVPAPAAWFEAEPAGAPAAGGGPAAAEEPTTLGVLQPFLHGSVDGWQLALNALSVRSDFTAAARSLGHATAEVHTELARSLPTVRLRRPQLDAVAAGMTERMEATARAVPALRPYCDGLRRAFDALRDLGGEERGWAAQRIHGDLHLGQTLRTGDGRWAVIDFEGEPSRPLAERRRLEPAVRDIAGILRSFDYAASSGPSGGDAWSLEWARATREAYCDGYAEAGGPDPRAVPELLRAYETDKAVYEVLYEARHRPDWLPVPLAAVRRLAAAAGGQSADTVGAGAPAGVAAPASPPPTGPAS
ncbi:maltokinase [Streptomyces sp. NPDC059740]|uniref:maltokinase N-terminal cap-like domain-containing protein n=1 Tax=Streptomyces sp. NPDC059740 TaxID=3346926 RepID=UPI00364B27D9